MIKLRSLSSATFSATLLQVVVISRIVKTPISFWVILALRSLVLRSVGLLYYTQFSKFSTQLSACVGSYSQSFRPPTCCYID